MNGESSQPTPHAASQFLKLKEDTLYDLICRACANGTAKKVAAAVAVDWIPTIEIDEKGTARVLIESRPAPVSETRSIEDTVTLPALPPEHWFRPFIMCPADEVRVAWQAFLKIAETFRGKL